VERRKGVDCGRIDTDTLGRNESLPRTSCGPGEMSARGHSRWCSREAHSVLLILAGQRKQLAQGCVELSACLVSMPCLVHPTSIIHALHRTTSCLLLLKSIQTSLHLLLAFSTSSPILHIPLYILDIITSPLCSGVGGILPL